MVVREDYIRTILLLLLALEQVIDRIKNWIWIMINPRYNLGSYHGEDCRQIEVDEFLNIF